MKFLIKILLILIFSAAAQYFLPFWSVVIVAFLVCLFMSERSPRKWGYERRKKKKLSLSFLAGFVAVALLWLGFAWYLDRGNDMLLSQKISKLFFQDNLPSSLEPYGILSLTGLIGGLLGGFGAMTGNQLGKLIKS